MRSTEQMPYITVPTEDVEQPVQDDATLAEGDYTGEPRTFATWSNQDNTRGGFVVGFYSLRNGDGSIVEGRKSYFITSEQPSARGAEVGRSQLIRLGAALGVTEEADGVTFIPGEPRWA
jgi:hypothetical protein